MKANDENLCRMARFGANISDAYGCYIFLPNSSNSLLLAGFHSLSNEVIRDCEILPNAGLVGWVAKHKRSIHVSPFERDSRTLGFYFQDQNLKSFIGIPVLVRSSPNNSEDGVGVIACDSKKSFAFSKLQGKLLEDLSYEITNYLHLASIAKESALPKVSWNSFFARSSQLLNSLGRDSIEIIRIQIANFSSIEQSIGSAQTLILLEQLYRLIEQALPPHFSSIKLPNGDMILVVDNMMTSFIENKILAICQHCTDRFASQTFSGANAIKLNFIKRLAGARKYRMLGLEDLINCTADTEADLTTQQRTLETEKRINLVYEYKRA
jgi:hypothetical protein